MCTLMSPQPIEMEAAKRRNIPANLSKHNSTGAVAAHDSIDHTL